MRSTSLAPLICATAADETYSESELSRKQTPPDEIFTLIVVFICGFCLSGYTGGICVYPQHRSTSPHTLNYY